MTKELVREIAKRISEVVEKPDYIAYIFSALKTDEQKKEMLAFLKNTNNLSESKISLKAVDINKEIV